MPNWCYSTIQFADREGFDRAATYLRSHGEKPRLSSIIAMPENLFSVPADGTLHAALRLYRDLYADDRERDAIDGFFEKRARNHREKVSEKRIDAALHNLWQDTATNLISRGRRRVPYYDFDSPVESLAEIDRMAVDAGAALVFDGAGGTSCNGVLELGRGAARAIAEHGTCSWHDWCCAHWGVKWDASITIDDQAGEMSCVTAWDPPVEAFVKLASDCRAALVLSFDDENFAEYTGFTSVLDNGAVYESKGIELNLFEHFQVAAMVNDPDQERYRFDPVTYEVACICDCEDGGRGFENLPIIDLFDCPSLVALDRLRRAL